MRWLGRGLLAVGVLLVLLLAYGSLVEPRLILDEDRHEVTVPGLPDGATVEVAVLSDLQVGMWWANTGMVRRAVERVAAEQPDVVLLGGDFVYSTDPGVGRQVDVVLDLLGPVLESGVPTFAVLGNHDYAADAVDELVSGLERHGVTVLRNESAPVGGGAGSLHVVGLGPVVPDRVDVEAALDDVPEEAPRVVLLHNPTAFPELPPDAAPLAVAGHTHCGQIALPGRPHWSYMGLTQEEKLVADGWAPEGYGQRGNAMFVTCGIGFSVVPVRINAPPQVVFFDLVGG